MFRGGKKGKIRSTVLAPYLRDTRCVINTCCHLAETSLRTGEVLASLTPSTLIRPCARNRKAIRLFFAARSYEDRMPRPRRDAKTGADAEHGSEAQNKLDVTPAIKKTTQDSSPSKPKGHKRERDLQLKMQRRKDGRVQVRQNPQRGRRAQRSLAGRQKTTRMNDLDL
jgi:hypothetical protein